MNLRRLSSAVGLGTISLAEPRSDDKSLAASHTMQIAFTLPPDFAHGEIADHSSWTAGRQPDPIAPG
jgi:hypothetical protein